MTTSQARGAKAGLWARARAGADLAIHHSGTEFAILLLILLSVVLAVAETAFEADAALRIFIEDVGDVITWLFVLELSVRFWVTPKKRRFFRRFWIDILSVLPVIRPLRLFRVVRLLRLFRAGHIINRRLSVFQGVFRGAGSEFTVLGTITVIMVLAGSLTLHLSERATNGSFSNLEKSLWFSVYSMISGEPVGGSPETLMGRGVTLILMLGGVTVFGMFVGTVSASMAGRLSQRLEVGEMDLDELKDHILLCGWNHSAPVVLRELVTADPHKPILIITEEGGMPDDIPPEIPRYSLYHLNGDYTRIEVLEQAQAERAEMAILLSDKTVPRSDQDRDARTVLAALTVERLSPGIFTVAELRDRQNEELLRRSKVEEIVVSDEYGGYIMGSAGRNRGLVQTLDEILTNSYGNAFHKVEVPESHDGRTVAEIYRVLKEDHEAVLIAVERPGEKPQVNPPSDLALAAGTELVVLSETVVKWS